MSIFAVVTLLSVLVCLFVSEIVYRSNKKESLNKIFALSSIFTAYLLFYYFMCRQAESIEKAYLWIKIGSFWPFLLAFYFHFVLIFTEKKKLLKNKLTYMAVYAPALIDAVISLTTNMLTGQPAKYEDGGYHAYGIASDTWLYNIFVIWTLLVISIGIVLCIHYFLKVTDRDKKRKAGYVLLGFSIPFVLTFIEESLNLLKIKMPETTSIAMVWMNSCIGYAIWRYDLFRIDPIKVAENIIATMPDSLILSDMEYNIIGINHSLTNSLKYSEDEIMGKPVDILFDNKDVFKNLFFDLMLNKEIVNYEVQFRTKSGDIVPILISGSVIINNRGKKIGIVCIARDITERKQAEESLKQYNYMLQQKNQELQDFAYVASHDLQEPLRKIITFGGRLKEKYFSVLEEHSDDYLDRMQNAAERMQVLINDLLTYSKVVTHLEPYSPVALSETVKDVLSDLEIRIEKTEGHVETGPLPVINADPTQMRQLFQNIIGNALKFHKKDKPPVVRISVLSEAPAGFFGIAVEDNGIGIEEKDYGKIFGVFQRLHGRNEYEGSGIGLSVCKKIIERHGGTIRVESEIGKGTKFIIAFPVELKKWY